MESPGNGCARLAVPLGLKRQVKIMKFPKESEVTHIAGGRPVCERTFCNLHLYNLTTEKRCGCFRALLLGSVFSNCHLSVFYSSIFPCSMLNVVTCRNTSLSPVSVVDFTGRRDITVITVDT